MMNKWLIVFFVILFGGIPKVVCAYDFESGGIYYSIDGDNVFVTSGDSKYQGVIAIPNQVKYNGKTYCVKIIGYCAFQDCKSLTSITIPNSVTSVGDFAFSSCSGLTSVTIPNSVTSIGICSFSYCYSLTTVNLPNSLTYIGKQAFWECYGLKSINIPPKVTYIGDYPFSGCSGLSSIKVDSGNMYYDSRNNCNAIIETNSNKLIAGCNTTIFPSNVTSIGDNSFQNCGGLSSLVIPSSVKSIGSQAFFGCRNLRNISIHDGVISVGKQAFYETAWYNNQPDGLIYIGKIAYEYKGKMPDNTRVAIRDGIIGIAGEAFSYCSGLISVTIPKSVTSIGSSAFIDCSGLSSIKVESGNPNYDSRNNCNAIIESSSNTLIAGCKKTKIPDNVANIGEFAFFGCSGLTSITIPNSVTSIGVWAFGDCGGLSSITIPNSVTSIAYAAFNGCSGLTTIVSEIEEPFKIDGWSTFSDDIYNNAELIVPKGTKAAYQATEGWNKFQNIVEASGGEEPIINPSTDYSDQYLTFKTSFHRRYTFNGTTGNDFIQYSINFGDWRTLAKGESVWVEGGDEIRWKGNLTPNPYYGIGNFVDDDEPFEVCGNIMSLIYGDDFIGKTSLDGKEDAFRDLFSDCADLVSAKGLVLPATTLADRCYYRMFINCTSLTTAPALPATTMSYGCYCSMFENCKSLTTAPVLPATTLAESCYSNMFDGCRRLTTAPDLPATKLANGCYNSMFAGCSSINHVKCLATDLGANSTTGWLYGVSSSGTFVKSSSMNDWARGESGIPEGWTIQNDNESSSEIGQIFEVDGIYYKIGENNTVSVTYGEVKYSGDVVIPESVKYGGKTYNVTSIGINAFIDSDLISITIPSSITFIDEDAFRWCDKLNSVYISDLSAWCKMKFKLGSPDNPNPLSYAHHLFLNGKEIKDLVIPNDVTSIPFDAFYGCSAIASVKIPNSVTSIGYDAFTGCKGLTTITSEIEKPFEIGSSTFDSDTYNVAELIVPYGTRGAYQNTEGWNKFTMITEAPDKDAVAFTIDGIAFEGSKSEKIVVVKGVDTKQTSIEIPASVSYDGTAYQVTGITDGVFDGNSMAALIWDVEAALPSNAFSNASIGSNFLLYVKSSSYAPSSVKNVVVDGTAQTIVLSDDGGQFYCPQAFSARRISYSHNYSMETGKGSTMGWESIALPFDVQRIIHSTQGEIVPFAAYSSGSNQKPFWLAYMSASGFKRTADIRANEAYIIAMPNNSSYQDNYILAGDVTFSAENITVPQTPAFNGTFLPAFSFVAKSSSVYALNVNNRYVRYSGSEKPGSVFIRDLRDVRPFEAYLTGNFTRGIIEINYDSGTTDILDVLLSTDDYQEMTIHTLSGQQLARTTQRDFNTVWQQLPKGVYIVKGKKLIK